MRRTSAPTKGARTRTHIFENFCAPLRTKIAAPARVRVRAHARTLKVCMLQRVCNVHWSVSYCIPKKPLNSVLKTTKTFNKLNGKRLCTDINSPNMMLFFSSFSVIQLFSCSLFDLLFLNIVFFSIIILSFSLQFKFQTFSFQLLQCWLLELYVDYLNDDEDMSE